MTALQGSNAKYTHKENRWKRKSKYHSSGVRKLLPGERLPEQDPMALNQVKATHQKVSEPRKRPTPPSRIEERGMCCD